MASRTLIIVIGGDYLAFEICSEILKTAGHGVVLVWKACDAREESFLQRESDDLRGRYGDGFVRIDADPLDRASLNRAGLHASGDSLDAQCALVAVSADDRLNLRVALLARDIDDRVRITLRQFNPVLGQKIQAGLKFNCTVISPAAHAAATYAAAAVEPSCFYALRFPTLESNAAGAAEEYDLFAFSQRNAGELGVDGMTVTQAEADLRARIVTVDGLAPYVCDGADGDPDVAMLERPLLARDRLTIFGPVRHAKRKRTVRSGALGRGMASRATDAMRSIRRVEPVLRNAAIAGAAAFAAFVAIFTIVTHWSVWGVAYYVLTTMEGSPDNNLCSDCGSAGAVTLWQIGEMVAAVFTTLAGLVLVAIFTASVTSGLNAAAQRRTRGLRRIHRTGHVIVCGAGNVGTLVIEYLRRLGERVVVVEKSPDSLLVEMARDRKIDLLTGDATNDETIALCSPERALGLVGVTNSDTANLEAALGARSRARTPGDDELGIVLRIDDLTFGKSIDRHFGIQSFSTTELTAATIAGLARFESTRGRFDLDGPVGPRSFQLAERVQDAANLPPPAPPERPGYRVRWIPLYVWRRNERGSGEAVAIRGFQDEVMPGDRLLFLVPLAQFAQPAPE
jgi:Trk K+ transport system NAD-binding subunit